MHGFGLRSVKIIKFENNHKSLDYLAKHYTNGTSSTEDIAIYRLDVKLNIIRIYRRNRTHGSDGSQFGT
jgi:hypothetical protein